VWDEYLVHGENSYSIFFQIEWDMIVVTVFLSILNQMEFNLVQNRKENWHHDQIPFNLKGNGTYSFLSVSLNNPIHRKLVEKNISTICVKIVCIDLKLQVNYEQYYTIPKYYYIIFTDTFLIDGSYDLIYWFRNVYELARLN